MRMQSLAYLQDNIVFTLGMGQLYAAAEALGIDFTNALSPIQKALAIKDPLLEATKNLLQDKDFVRAIRLLAAPDVKGLFKGQSLLDGNYASSLYIQETTGNIGAIWALNNSDGQLTLFCFKDAQSWVAYYLASKDLTVDYPPGQAINNTFTKESFLLLLNALDCYQHAYLYELLNYRTFSGNYISEHDFFGILDKGCRSNDLRWLVPAALHTINWTEKSTVNFDLHHLENLINAGLIQPTVTNDGDEKGLIYGGETLYLGLECAAFRKDVLGLEIKDLSGTRAQGLLITTAENMHWFDLQNEAQITHHCWDTQTLQDHLTKALNPTL